MSTARYSLNCYDPETEEILITFESRGIRWGQLVEIFEKLDDENDVAKNIELMEEIVLMIFKKMTRDDLKNVFVEDMVSVIQQVMALGVKNGLIGAKGKKAKN